MRHHAVKAGSIRVGVLSILMILLAISAQAQFSSSVEGTVKDHSGSVIQGASITLKNVQTGVERQFTSTEQGYFNFASIAPGIYTVNASKNGFANFSTQPFTVVALAVQTVPITLDVEGVTSTLTVTSQAPLVQLDNPTISSTVDRAGVEELPLQSRNVYQAAVATPGVLGVGLTGNNTAGIFEINTYVGAVSNGAPNSSNMYYIDNTENMDLISGGGARVVPSPDSVEEFTTSVNDYSAVYGQGGGTIFQVTTRGGQNQFHGSLFEYHQDNVLTARTEYQNTPFSNGRILPAFRRNEFGGSIGGPIIRNHTFAFFSIDKLLSTNAGANLVTVETPNFVSYMEQNRPNSIATQLLKSFPPNVQQLIPGTEQTVGSILGTCNGTSPSGIPCTLPLVGQAYNVYTAELNGLQWSLRVDQDFARDRFYGVYYHSPYDVGQPNTRDSFTQVVPHGSYFGNLNWTHTFTPNLLNQLAYGATRVFYNAPCPQCQVPVINISNLAGFGTGFAPVFNATNTFDLRDTATMVVRNHSLNFGFDFIRNQNNEDFTNNASRPSYSFLSPVDFADSLPHDQNISFDPITGGIGNATHDWRVNYFGFYVQDQWKVRPTFSLSPGLRWDFRGNPTDAHGTTSVLSLGSGNNLEQQITNASVGPASHVFSNNRILYFAPRLSFAWDPFGKGTTSIRGGAGIFFNASPEFVWENQINNNPPYIASVDASVQNTTGPQPQFALCASAQPPFGCPAPSVPLGLNSHGGTLSSLANVGGPDQGLRSSYLENWFLGVQHQVGKTTTVEIDYMGSAGHHLYSIFDRNRFAGDKQLHAGQVARLNPYFASITYADTQNQSSFQGLVVDLKTKVVKGLNLDVSYDFSKTIDLMSRGPGRAQGSETSSVEDAYDLIRQRGRSSQDLPHKLSFTAVWNIPGIKTGPAAVRSVVNGWQLTTIGVLESGLPSTVYSSTADYNGDGYYYDLPNAPARGSIKSNLSRTDYITGDMFSAADFPTPTPGTNGTLGRNTFRGPGFAQTDATLAKNFSLPFFFGEPAHFQIRGDFFNLFNRVNLNGWDTTLSDGTFGKATSTSQARTIQVAAKVTF